MSAAVAGGALILGGLGAVTAPSAHAAMTFTNKTTTDGLGSNTVNGVFAVGSTVYAATSNGLSISINGGATFTNRTVANGSLGDDSVNSAYAVGSTVYAATWRGLSISTDGGTTFTNKTTANGLGSNFVASVYAVDGTVYAATFGGLSISTNGGTSFTNKTTTNGLGSNTVNGTYVDGSTIYATGYGLSISTDGGTSFTNKTTANGLGSDVVLGVYAVGSTVYASTSNNIGTGGLSISTDGGATFANYTTADGLGSNAVNGVYAVGSTIYAATRGGLSVAVQAPPTPPAPPPVYPPSAPTGVTAITGDQSATVSWTPPSDSGSYPITHYQVTSVPAGKTCLAQAPAPVCEVTGLTNGVSYSFNARALNGAGWGSESAASNAVVPRAPERAALLITGTRGDVRGKPGVIVTGTSTGLGMGAMLRPWIRFPGQANDTQGLAAILVDMSGGFTWNRRTGKTISVYMTTEDRSAKSNSVVIAAP